MPLYEYRCTQCGNRFEKIQSFSSDPETECPKCHGKLERPLTAPAFQFKGAGWYVNDYAPKAASGSTDSKSADGAASSSDAKPAADTAAKPAPSESAPKPASSESASKPASSSSTT